MSTAREAAVRSGDPLNGMTLTSEYYLSDEIFASEMASVFDKGWTYVGSVHDVPEPGDRLLATVGRVPIVVTRTKSGELRALVNVCRHRMHTVAAGTERAPTLQCGYHSWTYDLDGRLMSAPGSRSLPGFDREANGLCGASIAVLGEWIFVNPDAAAAPMADGLTDCADFLGTVLERSSGYVFDGRTEYTMKANWKLFMENTAECYHCAAVHKDTFTSCFVTTPGDYVVTNYENAWSQRGLPKEQPDEVGIHFMMAWPNNFFGVDDHCAFAGAAIPVSATETRFIVDNWRNPASSDEAYEARGAMYGETFVEDLAAIEQVQVGVSSGVVSRGTFMPNELQVQDFAIKVYDALHGARSLEGAAR